MIMGMRIRTITGILTHTITTMTMITGILTITDIHTITITNMGTGIITLR